MGGASDGLMESGDEGGVAHLAEPDERLRHGDGAEVRRLQQRRAARGDGAHGAVGAVVVEARVEERRDHRHDVWVEEGLGR